MCSKAKRYHAAPIANISARGHERKTYLHAPTRGASLHALRQHSREPGCVAAARSRATIQLPPHRCPPVSRSRRSSRQAQAHGAERQHSPTHPTKLPTSQHQHPRGPWGDSPADWAPLSSPPDRDPHGSGRYPQCHRLPKVESGRGPSSVSQPRERRDPGCSRVAPTRWAPGSALPRLSAPQPPVPQGNPQHLGSPQPNDTSPHRGEPQPAPGSWPW
ncbi:hypothetical protein NDU88_001775 [Pleurodeles waltl]|uniref:Uncharacterized protein n=1 Tax=Pleurodeles waltl TaxID=8319 RepID=A0AAV7LDS2_PLEWA|nr:hypothetical protein NDU88_001775 [Pleurodeles waltl]